MEVKICLAANVDEAIKGLQSYLGGMEFGLKRPALNDDNEE